MQFTSHYSGSAGNLYQLKSGDATLLIEAGVTVKRIKTALDFCMSAVQGCLVSHSHMDHACGVKGVMKAGIDCYMTKPTADALGLDGHRLHIIEPGKQFEVGSWKCIAFETQHDCPGAVGYLVSDGAEKLLFATDTFYVKNRFAGLNIIAIEVNYSPETIAEDIDPARKNRLYSSHMSLSNAIKFLKSNDLSAVKELHLIHMSRDNSDPCLFKSEIEKATGKACFVAAW